MKVRSCLLAATLATAAVGASTSSAEELSIERLGVYVAADDIDRAAAFYEVLFGEEPQVRTPSFVGFDVAGGLYAIVSRKAYALPATPGGSTRPFIKVADIEAAIRRVQDVAPDSVEGRGIVREGAFRFFRFADSEGNTVEFFSVRSAQ